MITLVPLYTLSVGDSFTLPEKGEAWKVEKKDCRIHVMNCEGSMRAFEPGMLVQQFGISVLRKEDLRVGDLFLDEDKCLCVYMGFVAEFEKVNLVGSLSMRTLDGVAVTQPICDISYSEREVYACFYKNTWIMCSFEADTKIFPLNKSAESLIERMSADYVGKYDYDCE